MAYRLSPEATADLDGIWLYIARESGSIARAEGLAADFRDCFHRLSSFPHMGQERPDLRSGLRGFPVNDYTVLYRIEDEDVLIVHILHGRRDLTALFDTE